MATSPISSIKAVIGDGGFIPPIGKAHMRAIIQECGPVAWTIFSTIATHTDWRHGEVQFMQCHGLNIAALSAFTAMDSQRVRDALKALQEAGWLTRKGHNNPVWHLNADKLRAACAVAIAPQETPADEAPPADVDRIIAALCDGLPPGKSIKADRERGTAAFLLKTHSADAIIAKLAELRADGAEVFSLNYVKAGFQITRKERRDEARKPQAAVSAPKVSAPTEEDDPFRYGPAYQAAVAARRAAYGNDVTPF